MHDCLLSRFCVAVSLIRLSIKPHMTLALKVPPMPVAPSSHDCGLLFICSYHCSRALPHEVWALDRKAGFLLGAPTKSNPKPQAFEALNPQP